MAPATRPDEVPPPEVTASMPAAIRATLIAVVSEYSRDDLRQLVAYTRNWIQYGLLGFTIGCILIGAVERLFGR
jgi:hypothetical protein